MCHYKLLCSVLWYYIKTTFSATQQSSCNYVTSHILWGAVVSCLWFTERIVNSFLLLEISKGYSHLKQFQPRLGLVSYRILTTNFIESITADWLVCNQNSYCRCYWSKYHSHPPEVKSGTSGIIYNGLSITDLTYTLPLLLFLFHYVTLEGAGHGEEDDLKSMSQFSHISNSASHAAFRHVSTWPPASVWRNHAQHHPSTTQCSPIQQVAMMPQERRSPLSRRNKLQVARSPSWCSDFHPLNPAPPRIFA